MGRIGYVSKVLLLTSVEFSMSGWIDDVDVFKGGGPGDKWMQL